MSSDKSHDTSSSNESQVLSPCTVYFDGMCPVCSREIATYRQLHGGGAINWVDALRCQSIERRARPRLCTATSPCTKL
jgi:hypothetical protein